MSTLKDLVTGGAGCSAGLTGGPASRLAKSLTGDPTLLRTRGTPLPNRLGPTDPSVRRKAFATQETTSYRWEDEFDSRALGTFFGQEELPTPQARFGLESLRAQVAELKQTLSPAPVVEAPRNWAAEFAAWDPHISVPQSHEDRLPSSSKGGSYGSSTSHDLKISVQDFERFGQRCPALSGEEQQQYEELYAASITETDWEKEFAKYELWTDQLQIEGNPTPLETHGDREVLSATAGRLFDSVEMSNPKFRNSKFFALMRKLRDGDAAIEGDKVVEQVLPVGPPPVEEPRVQPATLEVPTNVIPFSAQLTGGDGPTWATGLEDRIDAYLRRMHPHGKQDADMVAEPGALFATQVAVKMESSWAENFTDA